MTQVDLFSSIFDLPKLFPYRKNEQIVKEYHEKMAGQQLDHLNIGIEVRYNEHSQLRLVEVE